ncbi:MAG: ssk1 response regulator receiver [Icmadophila ericetorum]|nr:ssk1 response regulator receiver [Icmadophila ericetorum]
MTDLKSRILPLFRQSSQSSIRSAASSAGSTTDGNRNRSRASLLLSKTRRRSTTEPVYEDETEAEPPTASSTQTNNNNQAVVSSAENQATEPHASPETDLDLENIDTLPSLPAIADLKNPGITLEEPTPEQLTTKARESEATVEAVQDAILAQEGQLALERPEIGLRRQSLAHNSQARFIKTLLESERPQIQPGQSDYFGGPPTLSANMLNRKIWVKRPNASATLVSIKEDDLVDDVRDMILKKYANSLGRSFDSPDVTLRIVPRVNHSHRSSQNTAERTLGPEEPITRTLDDYYPGGQTVDEALIIDVPKPRTPRHSPRPQLPYGYMTEDLRPMETANDYFPPIPPGAHSPHLASSLSVASNHSGSHHPSMHSISILSTGQAPLLPSPGSRGTRHSQQRPKYPRTHTSSPTVLTSPAPNQSGQIHPNGPAPVPPLPTPPIPAEVRPPRTATPPPRISSPRPTKPSGRSKRKNNLTSPLPLGLLDGDVPPINVLIVEDNIINLKLLEAFMKRLKVRWHTAMNGREAVNKWRGGGFHLVLMDIQLPVMNGLEATKEIRRLERINGVGFAASGGHSGRSSAAGGEEDREPQKQGPAEGEDQLTNTELFKSPVIIVALTASSLQSDRHEALAAGCNDFLTKPVNFVWLERKVMEWGCMQALIDFDGWRKWRDFSQSLRKDSINNPKGGNAPSGANSSSNPSPNPLSLPLNSLPQNGTTAPGSSALTTATATSSPSSAPNSATLPPPPLSTSPSTVSVLGAGGAPTTSSSFPSTPMTPKPAAKKFLNLNNNSGGATTGPAVPIRTSKREKRLSLGGGSSALTGVLEDGAEAESENGGATGAGGVKTITVDV